MVGTQYAFEFTGISTLLMHWDNIEWADLLERKRDQMRGSGKSKSKAGDDRTPPETWLGSLYNDGKFVAMPTDNIRSCLIKAGAKVSFGTKGASFKKVIPGSLLFPEVTAEFTLDGRRRIELKDCEAIKGEFADHAAAVRGLGFRLDVRRATIGSSKHVRVRPAFKPGWMLRGVMHVTDERLSLKSLNEIATIAGMYIGLGDWRPDAPKSPGPYGRFTSKIEPLKG